jgi:hypothetical protein
MTEEEVRKQFDETVQILEARAPRINLVLLKHPDKQMQDMDQIVVQTYVTPIGKSEPILFCQQIMERKLLEDRFDGELPTEWTRLSRTELDNELG